MPGTDRERAIVVGAGSGGLAAALELQSRDMDVLVLEASDHPGGCAALFERQGDTFLAGATTVTGMGPDGWLRAYATRRLPGLRYWPLPSSLQIHYKQQQVCLTSHDPFGNARRLSTCWGDGLGRLMLQAARDAQLMWAFWDRAATLPARNWYDWLAAAVWYGNLRTSIRMLSSTMLAPASWIMKRCGLSAAATAVAEELLLITCQSSSRSIPWVYACLGLDYVQQIDTYVLGGPGGLMDQMAVEVLEGQGALQTGTRVIDFEPADPGWRVRSTHSDWVCDRLVLDVPIWNAADMASGDAAVWLGKLAHRHKTDWSACTLYARVPDSFPTGYPLYHLIVLPYELPVSGARSLFVSLPHADDSFLTTDGKRSVTVSCHTESMLWEADSAQRQTEDARDEIVRTLGEYLPEIPVSCWRDALFASPHTWQRRTGRSGGLVGGLPFDYRRLGMRYPSPFTPMAGLMHVGDTTFPGQSVLSTIRGATQAVNRWLPR